MKKINKKEVCIFLVVLCFSIIVFLPWIAGHLATDTYKIYNIGYKEAAMGSLKDGRVAMYLLANVANFLNLEVKVYTSILLILALIVSTCSVILIRSIIIKNLSEKRNELILTILAYVTVFNFMYIENLYFAEAFVMAISIFLYIYIAKLMTYEGKRYIIKSVILSIIAISMYQGTIGSFIVIYTLLLCMKYGKNYKMLLKKFICGIVIIGISLAFNMILVYVINNLLGVQQSRIGTFQNIPINIYMILKYLPIAIINTCGLFPPYFLFIFIFLVTIVNFILNIKTKEQLHIIINHWIIMSVAILSGFATNILSMSAYDSGRLKFSIGALVGILLIYLFYETKEIFKKRIIKISLLIILFIYLLMNIINYVILIQEHLRVNLIEQETIINLSEEIKYYELNGNTIKNVKMVLFNNNIDKACGENININSIITLNALHCSWSSLAAINYYLQENFVGEFITESEYYEILEKNNLEDKDILLINNSIVVKIYMN